MCEMLSRTKLILASLNSICNDFAVRDKYFEVFFKARIIQSRTWPTWQFSNPRTLQKIIREKISF